MWRVEPDLGPSLVALMLTGDHHVAVTAAGAGETFAVDEPFPLRLDPGSLLA